MNSTVEAGERIRCTITAVSPQGALVSDTALIYAFKITVDDSGNVYELDVTSLVVVGDGTGEFRFVVVPVNCCCCYIITTDRFCCY